MARAGASGGLPVGASGAGAPGKSGPPGDRPEDLPSGYQLLTVEVPDGRIESSGESELDRTAPGWRVDQAITRGLTASWFDARRSLLLRVPSVLAPHSRNYLFNPLHPASSKAKIVDVAAAAYGNPKSR